MQTDSVTAFWAPFRNPNGQVGCPWCGLLLKVFTCGANAKPENQGRSFVNCSKKDGAHGCGLYCFLDEVPNDRFKPKAQGQKRERAEGTVLTGGIAATPSVLEDAVARLQADVTKIKAVCLAIAVAQNVKLE